MPVTEDQAFLVARATAVDRDGRVIGPVTGIYYDDHTGIPTWVTVQAPTRAAEAREDLDAAPRFVPLASAAYAHGRLHVDVTRGQVVAAPAADGDGHLNATHEVALYRYYGLSPSGDTAVDPQSASTARSQADDRPVSFAPPFELDGD